jgi:preprotein translocase subunit SecA
MQTVKENISGYFAKRINRNGVHLVTVNDYLAKRDSTWKAPLFEFHGMTVDCIDNHQPSSESIQF